mmetsp:Transcript_10213/g.20950  ORF Transcript_10213/g.20950 Transcript_10213/m.20950 type:complete len:296 (+) Transcript_10213:950-1837(+)
MRHGSVLVCNNLLNRRVHLDTATVLLNGLFHGLTKTVGLVTVEESHLEAIVLVEEPIHCSENDSHGKLVRIYEVKSLGHGNENLLVDALRHTILPHELGDAQLVLSINEGLAFDKHGDERRGSLEFLLQGEHLLVEKDRKAKVEGGRDSGDEIESCELPRKLLHSEDHLVNLPLQTVVDSELVEEVHHVRVGPEENVKSGLDPVSVSVLPGRNFSAENVASFVHGGLVTGLSQIFGTSKSGKTSANNRNLLLLIGNVLPKLCGKCLKCPIIVRVLNVRLRKVLVEPCGCHPYGRP